MSNKQFRFQTFKGKALLERLPSLSHLPHRERAKQCGYSTIMQMDDGRQKIQLNLSDFYDAILEARKQERHQPQAFDAVIGGQAQPPVEGVVLGGLEGVKRHLKSTVVEVRVTAISEALHYGEAGLDLVIGALKDFSGQVRSSAYRLLQQRLDFNTLQGRSDLKIKKALLDFDRLLLFTTLQGWKIENFNHQVGITDLVGTAYTVKNIEQLKLLLQDPQVSQLQALVCQYLGHYCSHGEQYRYIVDVLFDAYEQLTSLKALGINGEEQNPLGDISAILKVYPNLEALQVRGGCDLDFSPLRHNHLKTLIVNAQIDNQTISRICELELPVLEYLDLGCDRDDYYNEKFNIKVLMPIVSGKLFPKLRYLGIRGGKDYNKIASVLVRSTIVNRLFVLDLSNGNLGDKGAEALLSCPAINRLHTLNVSKNSLSSQMLKRLSGLKCKVIAKSQKYYRYSSVYE